MADRPQFIEPMECLATAQLPEGSDWVYEVKLDGYRAQVLYDDDQPQLLSRNGKSLASRFPTLLTELTRAVPDGTVLDGELVALDAGGKPSFSLIQNSASNQAPIVFFAFDLLHFDGRQITTMPLTKRRVLLEKWLRPSQHVRLSETLRAPAKQMIEIVRQHELEGVVAKRLSSPYEPGRRSGAWAKLRLELSQELVISGYTPGTHGIDAVLTGFYKDGKLQFCGSVRNGFVPASRRTAHARLRPLESEICPFVNLPEKSPGRWGQGLTAAKMKKCVWLRPEAVAQFKFLEWTPNDHLRHASFLGFRDDKDARSVRKETA